MNVVVYKTTGINGCLYDMSFCPSIDFEVLRSLRGIKNMEILTMEVPLKVGEAILSDLSRRTMVKRLIGTRNISSEFKAYFETNPVILSTGTKLPNAEQVHKIEDVVIGRVISLRRLFDIFRGEMHRDEMIEITQMLYCQRRIRMIPSVRRKKGKRICSFCEKEICNECCLGFDEDDVLLYAADNYSIGVPRAALYKPMKLNEVLTAARNEVNHFYQSAKKHIATIWCVPDAFDLAVMADMISHTIEDGGKILYITSDCDLTQTEERISELFFDLRTLIIDSDGLSIKNADFVVCSYNKYVCFHKAFDLVIYDSRNFYKQKPLPNMMDISLRAVKEKGKLVNITYIPEYGAGNRIYNEQELIPIPVTASNSPTSEPLIVISRTFREQIPEIAIDLVRWSIKDGLKTLIFVPYEELGKNVHSNLTLLGNIDSNEIGFSSIKDKSSILRLKKKELSVVITDDVEDVDSQMGDINVIVINADHSGYNRNILFRMASMAEHHSRKKFGQVMFVVERENEEVSAVKDRIRGMNKVAWERGYIKL